jgi:HSP20 family molecular chaperone IbpA
MSTTGPNLEQLLTNTFRAFSTPDTDNNVNPREMVNAFMNLGGAGISPPCDIVESEDEILIYLDVPGIDKNSIDVDFRNNRMVVTGTRNKPYDIETRRNEISYGNFEKRMTIPMSVTSRDNVRVSLRNGVLKIRVDKSAEGDHGFHVRLDEGSNDQ